MSFLLNMASALEAQSPGLLAALPSPDWALAGAAAVVYGVQRLVPTFDMGWYKTLRKPTWNPPNWVFPAMWIPLKALQSVALWLVWRTAPTTISIGSSSGISSSSASGLYLPLALFGTHLLLGNMWNIKFFGQHKMKESVSWMGAFWVTIAASIAAFYQVNPLAAYLFAPTLAWVTVAAKLNWEITQLNKDKDQ